jgi:ABC-type nickel/cobalt efflux system permease component RcnA
VGIAFGVAVLKLESIESFRGDMAAWLLLAFGLVYFVWGIRRAIRNQSHTHPHVHPNGTVHTHEHVHARDHVHVHEAAEKSTEKPDRGASMTPWVLFTIFLFGPCEPLIPILMYPAAKGNMAGLALVTLVFGVITIATMTAIVAGAYVGAGALRFTRLQRYSHALAGFVILACGAAIKAGL